VPIEGAVETPAELLQNKRDGYKYTTDLDDNNNNNKEEEEKYDDTCHDSGAALALLHELLANRNDIDRYLIELTTANVVESSSVDDDDDANDDNNNDDDKNDKIENENDNNVKAVDIKPPTPINKPR
jgi:hypothetical protein